MNLKLPLLSESDITKQVRDFLTAKGWRPLRMQRTVMAGQFSTCEPGTADFLFVYYLRSKNLPIGTSLNLWVELKKPKSRMRCKCLENRGTKKRCTMCDQKNWRERERAMGAVVWHSVDDLSWFMDTYEVTFGWLHAGDNARGQMNLLAGLGAPR